MTPSDVSILVAAIIGALLLLYVLFFPFDARDKTWDEELP